MLSDDPIISKVILRYKYWPNRKDYIPPVERVPLERELFQDVENKQDKPGILAIVRYLYNIAKGLIMKDWKTTVSGIVAAVAYGVHAIWGFYVPEIVTNSVISLALFAIGYFAGDKPFNK